jgi:hypothetical protein
VLLDQLLLVSRFHSWLMVHGTPKPFDCDNLKPLSDYKHQISVLPMAMSDVNLTLS